MAYDPAMDPETYLRDFHARLPGATRLGLGLGRTRDGRSGYRVLADLVEGPGTLLDVGCGDGTLLSELSGHDGEILGVDMSVHELRAASAGARLVQARAQALPFATSSFDWVVSHMALMLMPLEETLAEMRRVLRSGGRFVAMVQSDLPPQGAFLEFAKRLGAGIEEAPELADGRAANRQEMDGLLETCGLREVRYEDVTLHFAKQHHRAAFETLYGVDLVDDACLAHALATDGAACSVAMRLITARATA